MRISDWSSDVCSSDLPSSCVGEGDARRQCAACAGDRGRTWLWPARDRGDRPQPSGHGDAAKGNAGTSLRDARRSRPRPGRSEEHTSELQSLMRTSYAVFCLKKKKKTPTYIC